MRVSQAISCFFDYHKINSKQNTMRNYENLLTRFSNQFSERELESIKTDEILAFLTHSSQGVRQTTKRLRYSLLSAFFNFIRSSVNPTLQNPCETPILTKLFKVVRPTP